MKYYAKLGFVKSKSSTTSYILASKVGEVKGLKLGVYKDTATNQAKGVVGSEYIRFCVPENQVSENTSHIHSKVLTEMFLPVQKLLMITTELLVIQNVSVPKI